MSYPASTPSVPAIVRRLAAGRSVHAVWRNELGGVTFRVDGVGGAHGVEGRGAEFIKVSGEQAGPRDADFTAEARRVDWAARYLRVPRVIDLGVDGDVAWLRTEGLPGLSAVHPRWLAAPDVAVRAIGVGLRTLHDSLPVSTCPFDWSVERRLPELHPTHRANLPDPPPIDRLVVCHGDACAPNTLVDHDGGCCGHVDLGQLGVADRWADLAVATLSLGWNYPSRSRGRSWEAELFDAYGVDPDPLRIDYYRRLWQDPDL